MSKFSRTEDFSAIVLGSILLITVAILFLIRHGSTFDAEHARLNQELSQAAEAPFETIAWYQAMQALKEINGEKTSLGKFLKKWTGKPSTWTANPLTSMASRGTAPEFKPGNVQDDDLLMKAAIESDALAASQNYEDTNLNEAAARDVEELRKHHATSASRSGGKPFNKWGHLGLLLVLLMGIFAMGQSWMGRSAIGFVKGFLFVFGLAFVCQLLGAQANAKELGLGYAAWAIVLGLLISNTFGTPHWVKPALTTELFIKTGLVILGAEILFGKVLAIGLPGIFVAWIVTPIVLISTYIFGQKVLKIKSKTLNMTVSADMSVCGVSAAVATAAACKAKKEELTLAIGLSMIFTSVMMVVLPIAIKALGLPEVLGGAWIGGTIDATGAVVAAGAFLGDTALNVAATIKMIQNILIGIIAFGVAVYFSRSEGQGSGAQVGWGEVWRRFPKFILGFIGASLVFSCLYLGLGDDLGYALVDKGVIATWSKNIRGWLFCLAFVSIGLSTNFRELKKHFSGGKPLILYICGQAFNLGLTLLMAYVMFYLVFPEITDSI